MSTSECGNRAIKNITLLKTKDSTCQKAFPKVNSSSSPSDSGRYASFREGKLFTYTTIHKNSMMQILKTFLRIFEDSFVDRTGSNSVMRRKEMKDTTRNSLDRLLAQEVFRRCCSKRSFVAKSSNAKNKKKS